MSECVVRMEMPKHCGECELKTWDIWTGSFKCVKTMHDIMSHIRNRTKPNDCPILCQLPEGHGRLVDMRDIEQMEVSASDKQDEYFVGWNDAIKICQTATTIVPAAERSET